MQLLEGLDLRTYGQQLLAGRESKGLTQKQLSRQLFLPIHFIRALEAGETSMLPEIPYVMSMYRKVATAVDVDPEPMIQACKAFQVREGQPLTDQPQPRFKTVVQARNPSSARPKKQRGEPNMREGTATPQHTPQRQQTPRQKARASKADWVIVLVGCGLGFALVVVALLNSELWPAVRSRLIPVDPDPEAETVTEAQEQTSEAFTAQRPLPLITDTSDPQSVSQDEQLEQQLEEPEAGTVRFIFTAHANDNRSSWIRIENARGVLLFENTPEPGTSVDLPIAAGVRVRVGRPNLVRWQQPGQPAQALPQPQADGWIGLIPNSADSSAAPASPQAAA